MTVIAWDGTTLASDREGQAGGTRITTRKIWRIGDTLVGFCGDAKCIGRYRAWLESGAAPDTYPEAKPGEESVFILRVHRDGRVERFEDTGWPIEVRDQHAGLGSGHESARVAMHLGCTAADAVRIASIFDTGCGSGVDTLTFDDPPADA